MTPAPIRDFAADYAPTGNQIVFSSCLISQGDCGPMRPISCDPNGTNRHHAPCTWGPSQLHYAVFAPSSDKTIASAKNTKLAVSGTFPPCTFRRLPVKGVIGDLAWQPLPTP